MSEKITVFILIVDNQGATAQSATVSLDYKNATRNHVVPCGRGDVIKWNKQSGYGVLPVEAKPVTESEKILF